MTIVESFSQRLLRPVVCDVATMTTLLLVFLIVFEQRVDRLVAFVALVVVADDVLGAVCGYLLAAVAWSNIFLLVESFLPGSFRVSPGFSAGLDTWNGRIAVLSNVSLGSLTSVGSTAAVAVRPPATALVPLESLFGQFYIAVVVAQMVAARRPHER